MIPTDVPIHFLLVFAGTLVTVILSAFLPLEWLVSLVASGWALFAITAREWQKASRAPMDWADFRRDVAAGVLGMVAALLVRWLA